MAERQKLTYETITSKLIRLCQKNNVVLVLNDPNIPKDNGCAFGNDEIHLGREYSSNLIMMAIVLHEYGHCMIAKQSKTNRKYRKLSVFEEECIAWTMAMNEQKRVFNKSFTKSQGNFMLECLKTYSKQHYHFSKGYPQENIEED